VNFVVFRWRSFPLFHLLHFDLSCPQDTTRSPVVSPIVSQLRQPKRTTLTLRTFFFLTGMPEMLKPTSLIMGAGLGMDVACLTDGRFSGG